MNFSVSQLQVDELCRRKWWFKYPIGLKERQTVAEKYGTTMHSVLERYLKADDTGRDPKTGKKMELYPDGWDEGLEPVEKDQIQRLVPLAIEKGIIVRQPERLIEYRFDDPIPGTPHTLVGYIDYLLSDAVEDHKTTKSRRWALSPERLNKSLQMRGYAWVLQNIRTGAGMPQIPIFARHNVFEKQIDREGNYGPGDVFQTETTITPDQIVEFEEYMVTTALELQALKDAQVPEDKWEDVQGPANASEACNAYGGCPFRNICSGMGDTPAKYRFRMQRMDEREAGVPGREPIIIERSQAPMATAKGRLAALMGKKNGGKIEEPAAAASSSPPPATPRDQPAGVNPSDPPPAATAPTTPETEAATPEIQTPPWANASCIACGKSKWPGFDTKGRPCRICAARADREGLRKPGDFNPRFEDGLPVWDDAPAPEPPAAEPESPPAPEEPSGEGNAAPTASQEAAAPQPQTGPPPATGSRRKAGRKKATRKKAAAQTADETEESPGGETGAPTEPDTAPPAQSRPSRPRASGGPVKLSGGFAICFGVRPVFAVGRKAPETVEFSRFFHGAIESFDEHMSAPFWQSDPFRRRDILAQGAAAMVEDLEGRWLIVDTVESPEAKALLEAVLPLASLVIR